MKKIGECCGYSEAYENDGASVVGNPSFVVGGHKGHVLDAFDEHEVDDGCYTDSAKDSNLPLEVSQEVEGEDDASDVLNQSTEEEGYGYGEEDGYDDREGLVGINEVRNREFRDAREDFDCGQSEGCTEELEDAGDGGRGR